MSSQDMAYERAVLSARADDSMADAVDAAFLQEDIRVALREFRGSEHWARIRRLLDENGIEPGMRVLDMGGGRGLVAASLSEEGFRAVLCEPNPSEVCGAGAAAALAAGLEPGFEVHNGFVGELEPDSFDAVVCRAVLHHIHPMAPVLADARAVLKPGGVFIASDEPTIRRHGDLQQVLDEHPFVPFGVEEWAGPRSHYRDALSEAGFTGVEDSFPVAFDDYRSAIRPEFGQAMAAIGYAKYRVVSLVRPHPPVSRTFVARRAPSGTT